MNSEESILYKSESVTIVAKGEGKNYTVEHRYLTDTQVVKGEEGLK